MEGFNSIITACEKPSIDIMRVALSKREELTQAEADLLTYMAGFTHYREAAPVLSDFQMQIDHHPERLYDKQHTRVYFKLLIHDLSRTLSNISYEIISQIPGVTLYTNHIYPKLIGGPFITRYRRGLQNETLVEYNRYLNEHERALTEDGIRLTGIEIPNSLNVSNAYIFNLTFVLQWNNSINYDRLFDNLSAILFVPDPDPMHNLSVERLTMAVEVHEKLARALWFIPQTRETLGIMAFLKRIHAEYTMFPTSLNDGSYLKFIIENLVERASILS